MASTLTVVFRVEVSGIGTTSATHTFTAEAFDKIGVTVPAASGGSSGTQTVQVQPGGSGQVQLLFLTASIYPKATDGTPQMTYKVDGGTDIDLDAPLLLVEGGAVSLLGAVNEIELANDSSEDVEVQITVGRDATAP